MASIALLSNVTTGLLERELKKKHEVYVPAGYDTWMQELYDPGSVLNSRPFDAEFYLLYADAWADPWDSVPFGMEEMDRAGELISRHAEERKETQLFVSELDFHLQRITDGHTEDPESEWEQHWRKVLKELCHQRQNVHLYGWKGSISRAGGQAFYSDKMWYTGSMPFSVSGIRAVTQDIEARIRGTLQTRKKCIALDLDNTLWGGVAGEDGPDGILLSDHGQGKLYRDFQKRLKEIQSTGILLVILSKNNPDDIMPVLTGHPHMALRWEDFAGYRINWLEKTDNLRDLARELNIGLDSIVFIDDNPAEREAMRRFCPEVEVPNFPEDISQLPLWAWELYRDYFFSLHVTGEDQRKTQMYQEEAKRREVKKSAHSIGEYIGALGIRVRMHRMKKEEIARVSQLCMKTNQFNLTSKRYSVQEIAALYADPKTDIYTVYTGDRFGDNGLVSVLICKREDRSVQIDTFLMSCRVMGRYIENAVINRIIEVYRERYDFLIGCYQRTRKNEPVAGLYARLGFGQKDEQTFQYDLKQGKMPLSYIKDVEWDEE